MWRRRLWRGAPPPSPCICETVPDGALAKGRMGRKATLPAGNLVMSAARPPSPSPSPSPAAAPPPAALAARAAAIAADTLMRSASSASKPLRLVGMCGAAEKSAWLAKCRACVRAHVRASRRVWGGREGGRKGRREE